MQISFWVFLCITSYFSLTLWYGEGGVMHVGHTIIQAFAGLVMSLPLVWLYMKIWNAAYPIRFVVAIFFIFLISLVWTIFRIELFMLMIESDDLWKDFGGWAFSSLFIFCCWTGVFHGMRYYQLLEHEHEIMLQAEAEARQEQLKRVMAQTVARDTKIKMLRYQLNPHFLCNTLNAINSLIETEEAEAAQKVTVQLSKFLRYSLDHNPDTKISLDNELSALNLYLEIEKTRFADRLQLDFQIEDNARTANIPSLLLQPIIENSMKHVIAESEEGGTIKLKAKVENNRLILELSDTGTGHGVDKTKLSSSKGRGIGLKNIDERLKTLYENDYVFDLRLLPLGGLSTRIEIPYECLS